MAEFHKDVPRDLRKNLEYRIALRKRAARDAGFQRALITACKHDVLFFFSAFVWLYEPRPRLSEDGAKLPAQFPFIPWEHQVPAILEIDKALGFSDIGVEKSRGEGMSWIAVMLALRDWLFEDMAKVGMVSSTEKKADNPEDPDSLFWKIDWQLTKLPPWMVGVKDRDWKRSIDGHTLTNLRNNSRIAAYAATADVARGGRAKWFLMDELAAFPRGPDKEALASTQHVTNCRLVISTPKGAEGAYYEFMHQPSNMVRVVLDWKSNPSRNRGMYRLVGGQPVATDPTNPLPPDYEEQSKDLFSRLRLKGFQLEGKERSPWYDRECDRAMATPHNIAQELDRDYGGSMYRIFGHDFFAKAESKIRPPETRGTLTYHPETLAPDFDRNDNGPVYLWAPLDAKGRPPNRQYAVGCDVSSGLGGSYTSNSVIEVIDLLTGEQVLEYATNTVEPSDFADTAVAVCKWFHEAYLSWEINGPGAAFTKRIKELAYPHAYVRKLLTKRNRHKTKELGWSTTKQSKEMMFTEINRAVKSGEATVHSKLLAQELGQYVRVGDKIEHVLAAKTEDESSRGAAHGDRVMAYGVALMAAKDRPLLSEAARKPEQDPENPPPGTVAYRMREYERSLIKEHDLWDQRTNDDLAGWAGGAFATSPGGPLWT